MALTRQSESNAIYLEVKHYCLWRALKKKVEGCDEVEVTNPKTGARSTKYGYRFRDVSGHAVKLVKYDTEKKYATRYFGFKLHIVEGGETYILDMPYKGQMLRRFLRVARNINWSLPFSITIFKGKKGDKDSEETGVWFQQRGETIKPYYTREEPRGMPEAYHDPNTNEWDFRAQHSWLVDRLKAETIPDIEAAARKVAPPIQPEVEEQPHVYHVDESEPQPFSADLDDVPF
jgi:hypothetical protein